MNTETPDPGKVLLIDKPLGWTSFAVVKKLKWAGNYKKIGHAGTLDPLATGLLICCTGKMTKQIETYQGAEKEYTGTLVLGHTTPSVDLETAIDGEYPTEHITQEGMNEAIRQLTGKIMQTPPLFSAVKIDGKRAYEYARSGQEAEIKAKPITITTFEIDPSRFPEVDFRVVCSKGTYIRSLVRDFGLLCGSGAYMKSLRRTRIGAFRIEEATTLEQFVEQHRPGTTLYEARLVSH
ncbi:MAG: tRNA pseudouridine(55) synthase TruB [Siphonobacter sp.]